jgi:hypothetical protein
MRDPALGHRFFFFAGGVFLAVKVEKEIGMVCCLENGEWTPVNISILQH